MPSRCSFPLRDAGRAVLLNSEMEGGPDPWRVYLNQTVSEWTFDGSAWTKVAGNNTRFFQPIGLIPGRSYSLTFTMTRSAGTLTPSLMCLFNTANNVTGTVRSSAATFTETLIANAHANAVGFLANATFAGTISAVSIAPV